MINGYPPPGAGSLPEACFQSRRSIMLVLSRKQGESVVINDEITVQIMEIRGDRVRLGIYAPKEVPIHRSEVWETIHPTMTKPGSQTP